jgi:hypothetical protein
VAYARLIILLALAVAGPAQSASAAGFPSVFGSGARVDANDSGAALVAWSGPSGVRAAVGSRLTGFSAAIALSGMARVSAPQVAIDDQGTGIVVWETSRLSGGGECSTCPAHVVSDGVWAAMWHPGSGFAPAVRLAGARADSGADVQLADPRLAMSANGQTIVAWSDPRGAIAVFRAPGGALQPPQLVQPAGFEVADAAIASSGAAFLTDRTGRVAERAAGGSFGPPAVLPGANEPYGPGALIAADAAGDAIAVYRGTGQALVSRRAAGGVWQTPSTLTAADGSGARAAVMADDGTALISVVRSGGDPRLGGHSQLLAATVAPTGAVSTTAALNAPGTDGDAAVQGAGVDAGPGGEAAVALHQSPDLLAGGIARLAYRPPGGEFGRTATLTVPPGQYEANVDRPDVALAGAGELVAVWADHSPGQDRLVARWITSAGIGPLQTLDQAAASNFVIPTASGHAAQLTRQPHRTPDRRGRILVGLRCISFDHKACTGTLRLTAGPRKWPAGHRRFAMAPGSVKRLRVTLTRRALRAFRSRRKLTLTASAITTASGGIFGGTRGPIVLTHTAAARKRR